jgi:polyisoprenoid-binding protein YceI
MRVEPVIFRSLSRIFVAVVLLPAAAGAQRGPSSTGPAKRVPMRSASQSVRFTLAPEGNQARFTVREQLTIFESPNDAIGTTSAITGGITLRPDGSVDSTLSTIAVDLRTLTSDKENRDKWIKAHTLAVDSFPTAVMRVTAIRGLPSPRPASGTITATLLGSMTMHGVTHPTSWTVTLRANGTDYTGTATTHVKFEDFGMTQPRLFIVVSVIDDVKLDYTFHLTQSPAS